MPIAIDPITSLRSRLKQTGASQAEHDALEGLVVARDELRAALKAGLPHIDNSGAPGGCDGTYAGCSHCRAIRLARAALSKHKPAE
jgi:hypothetical protein